MSDADCTPGREPRSVAGSLTLFVVIATWCLILGVSFRVWSTSDEDIAAVETAPRGRLSSWALTHILVQYGACDKFH